jgi:hypothetical protein
VSAAALCSLASAALTSTALVCSVGTARALAASRPSQPWTREMSSARPRTLSVGSATTVAASAPSCSATKAYVPPAYSWTAVHALCGEVWPYRAA